jgi:NADH-quinone oxidoreductase subunit F
MVVVCGGTGCLASGAEKVLSAFQEQLKAAGIDGGVTLKETGCHGFCQRGPVVLVHPAGVFYQKVKPEQVADIVAKTVQKNEVMEELLYDAPDGKKVEFAKDIPFYAHQQRIALRNNGRIDPTEIEDSIAEGGYAGLAKALMMKPEDVISEVEKSGLRGRGGGGFATARKWRSCVKAPGDVRYLVCNGDEGDPGAFMDRSIMEGDPHSVIEGMVIGAYAIGAHEGFIYVRLEYPLAVQNLNVALAQARESGLLGKNILGTGFDFDIKINRGGGAFVCGESSALMASLEGKAGEPRAKYIHTVERGFRDKPTVLNNVETWACVSDIMARGAAAFSSVGTAGSKGTKVFSLVGKCRNNGLVEVPMGISVKDMVYKIGGGIIDDRKFKAVQTGGPSGGCIPAPMAELAIDFDELTKVGSMMGSGGLIVMDETDCMVDVARYFLKFLEEESCGKCVPCREGIRRMRGILERICEGKGKDGDIELLEEVAETVQFGSLCGLGTSAPNPVLSTLKHFRDEYEAHIKGHTCPAKVCKALITFTVNDKCNGCHVCARQCPQQCIAGEMKGMHTIDQAKCIKCGICNDVCRFESISVE